MLPYLQGVSFLYNKLYMSNNNDHNNKSDQLTGWDHSKLQEQKWSRFRKFRKEKILLLLP